MGHREEASMGKLVSIRSDAGPERVPHNAATELWILSQARFACKFA